MEAQDKVLALIEAADQVFDDVVEGHELLLENGTAGGPASSLAELLNKARTYCMPFEQEVDCTLCMACDHFIGCHPGEDGKLEIRCWGHQRRRLARGTREIKIPVTPMAQ